MIDDKDWAWLGGELRDTARKFGGQLRDVRDMETKVSNLEWSVAELGRHIVSLPRLYVDQNELGNDFVAPDDWDEFSAQARAHITTSDGDELAELLVEEVESMLQSDDPNERRYLYGCETTVANNAAGLMTECILHGQDLAQLTGSSPRFTRRQALAGLEQQMALTPAFVDPTKAAKLSGTYGLRFRGGPDFTYHVGKDGHVAVERGWPKQATARLNADPATFLASSLGRVNDLAVAVTAKIVVYGRKPWRFFQLGNAVVDGI